VSIAPVIAKILNCGRMPPSPNLRGRRGNRPAVRPPRPLLAPARLIAAGRNLRHRG
jgi:hypothetical protein